MTAKPAITQLNNGQVAPLMEGRPDIQVSAYSCRQTKNAIPLVYGSVRNRGGSAYCAETKESSQKTALVPFKVGENVAYMLEFGDHYIRFYKNNQQVMTTGNPSVPYEISSPWSSSDLFDSNGLFQLDYQQSADVMYLVHDKYPVNKLSRFSDTNWELSDFVTKTGPWQTRNSDKYKTIYASSQEGNVTLYGGEQAEINPFFESTDVGLNGRYNEFKFLVDGTPYPDDNWHPGNDGSEAAKHIVQALNSCQTDLIAQRDYGNQLKVTAVSNQNNYSEKTFTIYARSTGYNPPPLEVLTFTFSEYSAQGSTPVFTEDMVGLRMRIKTVDVYPVWYAGKENVAVGDIVVSDGKYYKAQTAGTCGTVKPTHTEGVENDGKLDWEYIGDGYGIVKILSVVSTAQAQASVEQTIPVGLTTQSGASYKWELELFGLDGIYPSSVAFFKDRLAFGLNAKTGPTVCFSCSGDYENFADMTYGEVLADNAITLPVQGDLNRIQWLCSQDNLFVGTEGGIIAVKAMTSSEVFGPNNVTYDNISSIGTCKIQPIRVGDDVLYLGRLAKDIYAIQYNWETDSYNPDEISLIAYNLLDKGVTSWSLQYEPYRIIWMTRTDGKIIGLTYNKRQAVRAFHLHETDGEWEGLAVIPEPSGSMDEIWAICKRTINNVSKQYVEYFKNGLPIIVPSGQTQAQTLAYNLDKAFYLDCAKEYTFEAATSSITGLNHLEGKTVKVFADGKTQMDKTVSSGAITLDSQANHVLVGLGYETILEPLPMNIDMPDGTGQGRSQRINQVIVRLYRSRNFKYSADGKNFKVAPVITKPTDTLKSGDLVLNWAGNNTTQELNEEDIVNATGARMVFKQDEPEPVYFVGFYPQIEVGRG